MAATAATTPQSAVGAGRRPRPVGAALFYLSAAALSVVFVFPFV